MRAQHWRWGRTGSKASRTGNLPDRRERCQQTGETEACTDKRCKKPASANNNTKQKDKEDYEEEEANKDESEEDEAEEEESEEGDTEEYDTEKESEEEESEEVEAEEEESEEEEREVQESPGETDLQGC